MSGDLERIAQAISEAFNERFDSMDERAARYCAEAAVAALQLTQEWRVEMDLGGEIGRVKCEPTPFFPRGSLAFEDVVHSRWVSQWVEEQP